jgi:hypothetical protein
MRRAHPEGQKDRNHDEVVKWLKALGASVQSLTAIGDGAPDLLIGYRGVNVLAEVKDGRLEPARRKLRPNQVKWHASWRGQVDVVECAEDAIALLKRLAPPLNAKAVIYVPGEFDADDYNGRPGHG